MGFRGMVKGDHIHLVFGEGCSAFSGAREADSKSIYMYTLANKVKIADGVALLQAKSLRIVLSLGTAKS